MCCSWCARWTLLPLRHFLTNPFVYLTTQISNFPPFFPLFHNDGCDFVTYFVAHWLVVMDWKRVHCSSHFPRNFPPSPQPNVGRLTASLSFCPVPPPLGCCAGFLTFRSPIFNHSRASLGHYAACSLSVDASELLNQHMSWGVFHDLFRFGLKLWVMPQKAILAQRTEEGIIIKRKKLFTICCNVLGDDIGNRHGLFPRAAGCTDPHQCLRQSLFLSSG